VIAQVTFALKVTVLVEVMMGVHVSAAVLVQVETVIIISVPLAIDLIKHVQAIVIVVAIAAQMVHALWQHQHVPAIVIVQEVKVVMMVFV